MKFTPFIRVPFTIQAAQITEDNLEEMAALLGEIRVEDDEKFIALSRRRGPNTRVYLGWWVTRLRGNVHCYPPTTFAEQFVTIPEDGRYVWIHDEVDDEVVEETALDVAED